MNIKMYLHIFILLLQIVYTGRFFASTIKNHRSYLSELSINNTHIECITYDNFSTIYEIEHLLSGDYDGINAYFTFIGKKYGTFGVIGLCMIDGKIQASCIVEFLILNKTLSNIKITNNGLLGMIIDPITNPYKGFNTIAKIKFNKIIPKYHFSSRKLVRASAYNGIYYTAHDDTKNTIIYGVNNFTMQSQYTNLTTGPHYTLALLADNSRLYALLFNMKYVKLITINITTGGTKKCISYYDLQYVNTAILKYHIIYSIMQYKNTYYWIETNTITCTYTKKLYTSDYIPNNIWLL